MTGLLPHHAAMLASSGVAPEVIAERGYFSTKDEEELLALGFKPYQARVPALVVPIYGVDGELVLHQVRPDDPRRADGKPVKYDTPARHQLRLDVPRRAREALVGPEVTLFITEGAKKADAAVSQGACCISVMGVWAWRGPRGPLGDWESVLLKDRDVVVVFDSDVMRKPAIHKSLQRFGAFLASRGASVSYVFLPTGPGGEKVGLDDFLAAGHTMGEVADMAVATLALGGRDEETVPTPVAGGHRPPPDAFFTSRGAFQVTALGGYVEGLAHLRVDKGRTLWRYEGGYYRPDGEVWARAVVRDLLGPRWRSSYAAETMTWLRDKMADIDVEAPPEAYLNLRNGLLDWRTLDLRDHDPEVVFTFQIPHRWRPEATCPKIERFVSEVIPADAVDFVYEVAGYATLPGNPFQKAILLTGPGGNGKTQLLTVLTGLVGEENVSNISLHDLADNKWSAAELVGRLANICGDIDRRALKRTDLFKKITGDDVLVCERKYGHPFKFKAFCVPIFSANEEPGTTDQTDAWWDRWLRIPMGGKIRGTEAEVPRIGAALAADEAEMEGLLVKAVDHLRAVMERGRFSLPESVATANEDARRTLDTVVAFVEELCTFDPEAWTKRDLLYATYKSWVTDGGQFPLGRNNFNRRLFHEYWSKRQLIELRQNHEGERGWKGIRLRRPGDPETAVQQLYLLPDPKTADGGPVGGQGLEEADQQSSASSTFFPSLDIRPPRSCNKEENGRKEVEEEEPGEEGRKKAAAPAALLVGPPDPRVVDDFHRALGALEALQKGDRFPAQWDPKLGIHVT